MPENWAENLIWLISGWNSICQMKLCQTFVQTVQIESCPGLEYLGMRLSQSACAHVHVRYKTCSVNRASYDTAAVLPSSSIIDHRERWCYVGLETKLLS